MSIFLLSLDRLGMQILEGGKLKLKILTMNTLNNLKSDFLDENRTKVDSKVDSKIWTEK
jgi:hypothetical protein